MRRIRKKIKRRVAALLAACMVTTSFPGEAFGAEAADYGTDDTPENVVLHLEQDKLKAAVEDAVRSGDEYSENLKFYAEDGSDSQPELYNQLFRDGILYEVSLEDAAAATPSDAAAEDGEVTILVRPDLGAEAEGWDQATASDAEEKATSSDSKVSGRATDSDADLSDYEATGNEQIIILFRNAGDNEVIYQIEVNGNLTPEITVPAGSTLISDLASESDAEELEEAEEEAEEEPAEDSGVPGGSSGGGSGSGSAESETDRSDSQTPSEEEGTEAPSENGDAEAPSEDEKTDAPSEGGSSELEQEEGSQESGESTDSEKPEEGGTESQTPDREPDSSENQGSQTTDPDNGKEEADGSGSAESHQGDSSEPGSGFSDQAEGSHDSSENKSDSESKDNSKPESSGSGSDDSADKTAEALTISSHLVPRVAAVGPSGEEYDSEASGLTPEEEWELFQEEGEDEEEEDYEEEESYEDELAIMAETSDTGMEGTVLEPVLVKREKFSFFRSKMFRGQPVAAAAYVTTLNGLGRSMPKADTSDFTVDLFDYGTFDPAIQASGKINKDSWKYPHMVDAYPYSNGTQSFNKFISGQNTEQWKEEEKWEGRDWKTVRTMQHNAFVMAPREAIGGLSDGATTHGSIIRGIVKNSYGEEGLEFREPLNRLANYGNTIFPSKEQYDEMREALSGTEYNNQWFEENFKAYYNVYLPLEKQGDYHYRITSDENYITGGIAEDGKRGMAFNTYGYYNKEPYVERAGFWPLNNHPYNEQNSKGGNQNFGMKFSTPFYLPENGMWKGEPLKFTFTGDDDVWVFIDGQLVLDMGGLHQNTIGTIDFSTGYTQIYGNGVVKDYHAVDGGTVTLSADAINGGLNSDKYVAGYIYGDIQEAKGKADSSKIQKNNLESERCISIDLSKGVHTLDFYLVERAPYGSNCTIDFTLPVMPNGNLNVAKKVQKEEGSSLDNEYTFKVQKQENGMWEDYKAEGFDGTFTLKEDGTKNIPLKETGVYRVAEINSWGATTTWAGDGMSQEDGTLEWRIVTVDDVTKSYNLVCTNNFIDRSQIHSLTVTKEVRGTKTPTSVKFPFHITLDASACEQDKFNATYKVGDGEAQEVSFDSDRTAQIDVNLADNESVVISGIPYGTQYSVEEDTDALENSLYRSETATPQKGKITTQDAAITWKNSKKSGEYTSFTVKKEVEGVAPEGETYQFALYQFPRDLNEDGTTFWTPYEGSYYVNGFKAEKVKNDSYPEGMTGFELSKEKGMEAVIEIPKTENGGIFLAREIDNGTAATTQWAVDGETVNAFDTPAFQLRDIAGKTLTCTNSYTEERTLVVEKKLEEGSENPDPETNYGFLVTGGDGKPHKDSIKVGAHFEVAVEKGQSYTVSETIPAVRGYVGSLSHVEGAEKTDGNTATVTIDDKKSEQTFEQVAHAYHFKEKSRTTGNWPSKQTYYQLELQVVEMGEGTPNWGSGTTVLRSEEYQKKRDWGVIDNTNRTEKLQAMIQEMEDSNKPYQTDGTFYPATGGQFALVEAVSLSDIEFTDSLSRAFVICDGICYEYNEYMKFDVKEKLQKTSGGTVTDIQMVDADGNTGVGYHKESYNENIDNAATIRLRVTLDTSSSAKQWVTFYNKWEEGLAQMMIEKTIDEADTEDNTFLFEVSGTDGSKFYTSVVIPAGETKGSQTLESIPAGTWAVKELDHMRYELADGIENPQTKELSAKDPSQNVFSFANRKVSDGYFSDSSLILNQVNEDGTYTQSKDNGDTVKGLYEGQPAALLSTKHDDDGTDGDGPVPPTN